MICNIPLTVLKVISYNAAVGFYLDILCKCAESTLLSLVGCTISVVVLKVETIMISKL